MDCSSEGGYRLVEGELLGLFDTPFIEDISFLMSDVGHGVDA